MTALQEEQIAQKNTQDDRKGFAWRVKTARNYLAHVAGGDLILLLVTQGDHPRGSEWSRTGTWAAKLTWLRDAAG